MYTRILVPLDGSKLAEGALQHVRNIAHGNPGLEVILLTVHEEILPFTSLPSAEFRTPELVGQRAKMDNEIAQNREKYLADTAASLAQKDLTIRTMMLFPDPVKSIAEMIIEYAEACQVDLIVMSTHGRSGIKRWAFGTVADRVVNYSSIPVLVVPAAARRV